MSTDTTKNCPPDSLQPRVGRQYDFAALAEDAIDLFVEYRDRHGYNEPAARSKAVCEVIEGMNDLAIVDVDALCSLQTKAGLSV